MELTKEDYLKAAKAATKVKKESYFLVQFTYDNGFVLPYKQGIQLIEAMEGSYLFRDRYDKPPTFKPIEDEFTIRVMSEDEITSIKVAQILNISLNEAKKLKDVSP